MGFFVKRLLKQLLVAAAAAFVIRKLAESSNPKAQRVGRTANRLMGGIGTSDPSNKRPDRRR